MPANPTRSKAEQGKDGPSETPGMAAGGGEESPPERNDRREVPGDGALEQNPAYGPP